MLSGRAEREELRAFTPQRSIAELGAADMRIRVAGGNNLTLHPELFGTPGPGNCFSWGLNQAC